MFRLAYDTTPCMDYEIQKIKDEIERVRIDSPLWPAQWDGKTLQDIQMVVDGDENKNTPPFSHPIEIEENTLVIDARGMSKVNQNREFVVSAKNEYDLLVLRAMLTRYWIAENPKDLYNLGEFPLRVYIRWLSDAIGKRLALDPAALQNISAVLGIYYYGLFRDRDDKHLDDKDKSKLAMKIAQSTYLRAEKVLEIADNMESAPINVYGLVEALQTQSDSPRLEKFNAGLLYQLIGGGWFGFAAKELMAVAVEHPPTFLALVYTALNDRSYRRTMFTKVVEDNDRRGSGKQFSKMLANIPLY